MNIRNNMDQGLRTKIIKCIDLLDDEFKTLNFTIDPYQVRERLIYERDNKPDLKKEEYEQILNGEVVVGGLTHGDKKQIKIFLFFYEELDSNAYEILHLIGNIFHEIRHAWQIKNNLYQEENEISKLDGNLEFYFGLEAEKDAYQFQLEQMQKHANKILEIFNNNARVKEFTLKDEIMKFINS
ncbi:hypothetical protein [Peribacillus simplex]|uniref:hypothetical protein n=1 Tax=Peribacillus simplex TaxID=1478 RepID=UPI0024C1FBEB|nr:hypothetical protein [Peribacillus simplex]MDR4928276.1 hypothetical protein [Peribacillus simplex]WHX92038.1 hypothetical protein QNH50_03910 [Peribacillus simplex]